MLHLERDHSGGSSLFYFMKIHITQEDFGQMAMELCTKLLAIRDKFEWIVGIERGGVPLSTWLAYALNKKHTTIKISFYKDGDKPNKKCIVGEADFPCTENILVVDDIVDSGNTMAVLHGMLPSGYKKVWIATLHWCEENSPLQKPDFFVEKKKKSDWIVYPWCGPNEGVNYSQ